MGDNLYVQVAVNLPLKDVFDYSVPLELRGAVAIGKRVWVPFRNRAMTGVIVKISGQTAIAQTKDISRVIDDEPLLSPDMLALTRWMADYYFCSWGEAIEAAVAGPFKHGKTTVRVREISSSLLKARDTEKGPDIIRTEHQDKALTAVMPHISAGTFGVFLLHGITASGKTEVYFGAIEAVLRENKEAIVLVPEIALTPQTLQRFTEKFGKGAVAVIHSRLSKSEKFLEWQRIKKGEAKIIIGARSAIFSPVKNLGLIVVDEEHENTYKQEDVPRYHLVTTAVQRARLCGAVVILGSATPSLESTCAARRGEFEYIELPQRILGRGLPEVHLVDMRGQRGIGRRPPIISKPLEDSIRRCLQKKEQVIIFLNRRGFSTFINCSKCGYVAQCPRCNVALVYHFDRKELLCHHCSYHGAAPEVCPECNADYIRYFGTGTQKVESELSRLFPDAIISRMDSDALKAKTAHFDIFHDFKDGKIDILVGTQMLAKGLDFPRVTLVGVISADVTLNLPDFRASERTFSLLTQVAGRAGRGVEKGKVIIQTHTPDHYAIQCAITHDYNSFYEQEMVFRQQLNLPPCTHLISLVLRSKTESLAAGAAQKMAELLRGESQQRGIALKSIGPAPMPVARLRGYFRWMILLKSEEVVKTNEMLKHCLQAWRISAKVKLAVDVDPLTVI
jgi:primosomal protein N' (replication factor Y)